MKCHKAGILFLKGGKPPLHLTKQNFGRSYLGLGHLTVHRFGGLVNLFGQTCAGSDFVLSDTRKMLQIRPTDVLAATIYRWAVRSLILWTVLFQPREPLTVWDEFLFFDGIQVLTGLVEPIGRPHGLSFCILVKSLFTIPVGLQNNFGVVIQCHRGLTVGGVTG